MKQPVCRRAAVRLFTYALLTTLCPAVQARPADDTLEEIVVTGAREAQPKTHIPATVHTLPRAAIEETRPIHPSQLVNQFPGVWVNVTQGEGHMTAIRQPLTTSPVYLYLEDGVPVRSTGFFNHNALYEINIPQAEGIEVIKGPGTVLHGSDAIGGVVNVLTRPAPKAFEADAALQAGAHGWRRLSASVGDAGSVNGLRAGVNLTRTDGWRDATDYDRRSATVRWDRFADTAVLKTVLAWSDIDQHTAGASALSRADYLDNPTLNYYPISFRRVKALRLSSAYEQEYPGAFASLTPYVRYNDMDLLPNWTLAFDPTVYNTRNTSYGLLAKYRLDLAGGARLVAGFDLDHSPGSRHEQRIVPVKEGKIYTSYTLAETLYDYDVTFQALSPYVQGELPAGSNTRVTAGLRYDLMRYDYDNRLGPLDTGNWKRPASTTLRYRHTSPKLGLTYAIGPGHALFAGYGHGFRVPSEGQLFRQGSAASTVDLQPVKADQLEIGYRARRADGAGLEVSIYRLTKKDDILTFRNPVSGLNEVVNAGRTLHRGIELGVSVPLPARLRLEAGWSYGKHTYEQWVARSGMVNVDFSGNEMETAPRVLGNTRLSYAPAALRGGRLALEWQKLGRYWEDAANTRQYEGHDLIHLRASYPASRAVELFGQVFNLTDRRFAENASYTAARGEELAPGLPRTFYAGLEYRWR